MKILIVSITNSKHNLIVSFVSFVLSGMTIHDDEKDS